MAAVAFIAAGIVAFTVGAHRVKRWVRRHMIPEGEARGVDFEDVMRLLFSIESGDDAPPHLKKYLSDRETIAAALLEDGIIDVPE